MPQVKVKMATADDEMTTDISIEGDPEEIDRFRKVSGNSSVLRYFFTDVAPCLQCLLTCSAFALVCSHLFAVPAGVLSSTCLHSTINHLPVPSCEQELGLIEKGMVPVKGLLE